MKLILSACAALLVLSVCIIYLSINHCPVEPLVPIYVTGEAVPELNFRYLLLIPSVSSQRSTPPDLECNSGVPLRVRLTRHEVH